MKYKLFLIACFIFASVCSFAHPINGYKYIHIVQNGNLYDIEDRLAETFSEIGFVVLENGEEDEKIEEKHLILHVTYGWQIRRGAPSELTVVMYNDAEKKIFQSVTNGNSFTASGDMKNAISKLKKNLKKLNYHFVGPSSKSGISLVSVQAECSKWSEDSIKSYLKNKRPNSIEGIYKNLSGGNYTYRFAIIREKEKFYAIVLESNNQLWDKGSVKMTLSHIEKTMFDVEIFDGSGYQNSCLGKYENRVLDVSSNNQSMKFIKVYPSSGGIDGTSNSSGDSSGEPCRGIGSGILLSDKVIVTNNHVIEDAERIEVVFNVNSTAESYNAKILVTDKANDLALLVVKDDKFKTLPSAPYKIIQGTVDVGTSIFTMGYPMSQILGDEVKVTDGIISAKSGYEGDIRTYQISAPIQPGNSGGALFDKKGNLVGITNAGVHNAENIGYAIKTSYLLNLIDNAPIDIAIPQSNSTNDEDLPTLIKKIKPYIAVIKVF